MEKNWQGLDFLRGIGIFFLIVMHTAFYYFNGLWDLDLENPPLIITIIGFLLMFAGLFAIISGAVHGIGMLRLRNLKGWPLKKIAAKKASSAAFILILAYIYFIFTGPGLSDFENRRMNNSILVEWIRSGRLTGFNLERVLYVDSLVMIGSNILLVALIWIGLMKINKLSPAFLLSLSGFIMLLSLLRLPLYPVYLEQIERANWVPAILLNWFVNKNNPIMPFLAFGLLGSWLGLLLEEKRSRRLPLLLGLILFTTGMVLYVFLPDTMLQRAIDLKWYSIMVAQLGLFILLVLGSVALFDRPGRKSSGGRLFRFICRFGSVGLTAFFWESVVAAITWRLLSLVFPRIELGIPGALLFGLGLAIGWGVVLMRWEKHRYVGTVESLYVRFVTRFGQVSSKADKLANPQEGLHP